MSHIYVSYVCVTCIHPYVKKRTYDIWMSESCLTHMCPLYVWHILIHMSKNVRITCHVSHIRVLYMWDILFHISKKYTCDKERASSFSHMNEWCPTIGRIRSHIGLSHITHMNESCQTYGWVMNSFERVTSHIGLSRITPINESCHTVEWVMNEHVMSPIWMSKSVSHMNESCPTIERVSSHIGWSHITHMNESCHTCEWVMSHV